MGILGSHMGFDSSGSSEWECWTKSYGTHNHETDYETFHIFAYKFKIKINKIDYIHHKDQENKNQNKNKIGKNDPQLAKSRGKKT